MLSPLFHYCTVHSIAYICTCCSACAVLHVHNVASHHITSHYIASHHITHFDHVLSDSRHQTTRPPRLRSRRTYSPSSKYLQRITMHLIIVSSCELSNIQLLQCTLLHHSFRKTSIHASFLPFSLSFSPI